MRRISMIQHQKCFTTDFLKKSHRTVYWIRIFVYLEWLSYNSSLWRKSIKWHDYFWFCHDHFFIQKDFLYQHKWSHLQITDKMRRIVRKIFISKTGDNFQKSVFTQVKQGWARHELTITSSYEKKRETNYHLFSLCSLTNRKSFSIDVAIDRIDCVFWNE